MFLSSGFACRQPRGYGEPCSVIMRSVVLCRDGGIRDANVCRCDGWSRTQQSVVVSRCVEPHHQDPLCDTKPYLNAPSAFACKACALSVLMPRALFCSTPRRRNRRSCRSRRSHGHGSVRVSGPRRRKWRLFVSSAQAPRFCVKRANRGAVTSGAKPERPPCSGTAG